MTSLVLGTAQFGAGYGVTNQVGRLDDRAVREIVAAALDGGIGVFDTAPDYGDAQERLGALVPESGRPGYVSKFGLGAAAPDADLYEHSMRQLRVGQLHGLLYHRVSDLRDPRVGASWEVLRRAKDAGLIRRIGASVYDVRDLEIALDVLPGLDLLQIPGNVLDRRLLDHSEVLALHARSGEVHVRSAYLQGLLLADPVSVPPHLAPIAEAGTVVAGLASAAGASPQSALLGYLKHHPAVDAVVIGALSAGELATSIAAWDGAAPIDLPEFDIAPELLDPRTWAEGGAQ